MVISNNQILQSHWAIYIFRFFNALSNKESWPGDTGTSWLWIPTYSRLTLFTSQHKTTFIEIRVVSHTVDWNLSLAIQLVTNALICKVSRYTFRCQYETSGVSIHLQVSACTHISSGVCMHLYTFRCHYAPSDVSRQAESVNNCGL